MIYCLLLLLGNRLFRIIRKQEIRKNEVRSLQLWRIVVPHCETCVLSTNANGGSYRSNN